MNKINERVTSVVPGNRLWASLVQVSRFQPIWGTLRSVGLKSLHGAFENPETFDSGRFLTGLKQKLIPETDSEKFLLAGQPFPDRSK